MQSTLFLFKIAKSHRYNLIISLILSVLLQPLNALAGVWQIKTSFSGTAISSVSGTYDLSGLAGTISTTGGATSVLYQSIASQSAGLAMQRYTSNAKIIFTFVWLPDNGILAADPAPQKLTIFYTREAATTVGVRNNSLYPSPTFNTQVTCDSVQAHIALTCSTPPDSGPVYVTDDHSDPSVTTETLDVMVATAVKQFSPSINISLSNEMNKDNSAYGAVTIKMDLNGFDIPRAPTPPGGDPGSPGGGGGNGTVGNGGGINRGVKKQGGTTNFPGNTAAAASDPTFTRWLPLSFSPVVQSQQFRFQVGALPAPWGNLQCAYSISLKQEPNPPNYDLPASALLFAPTWGNPPGPPYTVIPGNFTPKYTITDANGDRLHFDAGMNPYPNVFSSLTYNVMTGVYTLSSAGPPGSIRFPGNYTYVFGTIASSPVIARLATISDDLGNQQTLQWGSGSNFLTVFDNTSLRSLIFNPGTSGYVGSVDAPPLSGTTPNTHTALTFDGSGHLTIVKVYPGGSTTALRSDTYTYSGDAIASITQGASTTAYNYVLDSYVLDPFSNPVPRIAAETMGTLADTSSSDNGATVQGTYTYTYGAMQAAYNHFSINSLTNTMTEPRGNLTSTYMAYQYGYSGPMTGYTIIGPTFAGAGTVNGIQTWYSPNIAVPTSSTFRDQYSMNWNSTYDFYGNLLTFTDPLNNVSSFTYDTFGKYLTSTTDPLLRVWTFAYGQNSNPASRLTGITDPTGTVRAQYGYNNFGQLLQKNIGGNVTQYTYNNSTGDLISLLDPMGDTATINAYDALGDPLSLSAYPDTGNPATSTHPLTTTIGYDAGQMVTQIAGPSGTSLNTAYTNGVMSQLSMTNQGSTLSQINLSRDSRGRIYAASDLVGSMAQYKYDKSSNRTKVLDGLGHSTTFAYGGNNELTRITWPNANFQTFAYDGGGRVSTFVDERNNSIVYTYNPVSALTDVTANNNSVTHIHYTYDVLGNVLTATNSTGSRTYTYDTVGATSSGRLMQVTTYIAALPAGHNTFNVSYTYYSDGKVHTLTTPAGLTTYTYDTDDRLSNMTDPFSNSTTWTYDHAGRATNESTLPSGGVPISTSYIWGGSNLVGDPSTSPYYLNAVSQSINSVAYWQFSIQHSYLGQVLAQSGSYLAGQSTTDSYTYDARGRLSSNSNSTTLSVGSSASGSYTYDLSNNVSPASLPWTYNTSNQLTAAPANTSLPGGTGLTYDNGGNIITVNGTTVGYDAYGQLVSMSGATTASMTYDSAGRRVSKTTGGVTTYYLYSGGTLIAELDSTGAVKQSYNWGALGLVSDRFNSASRFYFFDASGNTSNLLDKSGVSLGWGAYTAWGTMIAGSLPSSPYGWKGRYGVYNDSSLGLYLMGARYYAANLGRFISRDPIGFDGGINLYAYCADDPINLFDPFGLEPDDDTSNMTRLQQFANALTGNSVRNFGDAMGRYDAGKASAWDVAKAGAKFGVQLGSAGFAGAGLGKLALAGGRSLLGWAAGGLENSAGGGLATVSRWGSEGLNPGDWVMKGPANLKNWIMSGKCQPGLGNEFAPLASGQEFQVPASSLRWPSGWGIDGRWKGLFGQRIYRP